MTSGGAIFTVLALILWIVKYLSKGDRSSPNGPPPTISRPARPPDDSEQERLRRFREAVGLPVDLPPPVRPQAAGGRAPLLPVNPPKTTLTTPGRLRRVPAAGAAPQTQPAARVIPPVRAAAPVVTPDMPVVPIVPNLVKPVIPAAAATADAAKPSGIPASSLLARLRDPLAVREAMILREVLGPPRAFAESGMGLMGALGLMRPRAV